MFRLTKRRKFIASSVLLTAGMTFIQFGQLPSRYLAIGILCFLTIIFFLWSLSESLKGISWLVVWILPVLFTSGVGLFYFLLPSAVFSAVPVIILYFLGLYALFLSENIFTVAAIRTIQLFRSASAVSFLLTLFVSFLLYDTVFSFRLPFYFNAGLVFFFSFLLFFHGIWSVELGEKINSKDMLYSIFLSSVLGEISFVLSFWPASVSLSSLFLTALLYVLLGLTQAYFSDRLFEKTVKEYLLVGVAVFLVLIYYTSWG